ncbi:peptidylprolyl isomerase [Abditibacterium utsteinense]|uniref:Peptidyl-prolyl cis-trans isomerase n=1 Tax=Abditibacterium utsteinense TaxID=1960156 RepID=A0A2S8SVI0_9BACT|nr:FKBP-type peptidyl-prolyl cis-trans isomerase [Abditibacterium utsteinense]PQV64798.1 peptidylprolyl isomerase [Abditibacterium utsteinense]
MEKSKLAGIAVLVALGGALLLSKSQDAPAPPADPDAAEHSESPSSDHAAPAAAPDAKLVGGVTALKTEDLRPGTGAAAQSGDSLSMNYKGSLLNGEVFDQSYGRAPFDFELGAGRVIKGWDQGIVGMKEGGKRKLTIPASLGYGEQGSPPKIPGGATLVFEVELLKVSKKSG